MRKRAQKNDSICFESSKIFLKFMPLFEDIDYFDFFNLLDQMNTILSLYQSLAATLLRLEQSDKEEKVSSLAAELEDYFSAVFDRISWLREEEGINNSYFLTEIELFQSRIYLLQASLFRSLSQYNQAETALKKALDLAKQRLAKTKELEDYESLFELVLDLDGLYKEMDDKEGREEMLNRLDQLLRQAEAMDPALDEQRLLFWTFALQCQKTSFYLDQPDHLEREKAMEWALKAQSSLQKLEKEERAGLEPDSLKRACELYENLALLSASRQDFSKAKAFLKQAEPYRNQIK